MAGALRKAVEFLGLAETDDQYDNYTADYQDGDRRQVAPAHAAADQQDSREREREYRAEVTPLPQRTPVSQVVSRPEVSELTRITTIHPRTYSEAKDIGENFRDGIPVIINLTEMDDADAKRLVDFAAGLAFGLHGSIERVTAKVFLLSPSHIQVDAGAAEAGPGHPSPFNQS